MVDLELAVHNVIRLLLPNTVTTGCLFHFAQDIYVILGTVHVQ